MAGIAVVCRLDGRFDLGTGVLWGLTVWGFGYLAGGLLPLDGKRTPYNAILGVDLLRFDRLVHAFGFGSPPWPAARCCCGGCRKARCGPAA